MLWKMFTFTIQKKQRNEQVQKPNNIPYVQMYLEIEYEAEIVTANIEYV